MLALPPVLRYFLTKVEDPFEFVFTQWLAELIHTKHEVFSQRIVFDTRMQTNL